MQSQSNGPAISRVGTNGRRVKRPGGPLGLEEELCYFVFQDPPKTFSEHKVN